MLRRPLVLLAVAAVAALLAPAALATVVHVRVEGKTRTIFGAAEPRAFGSNALEVLESASLGGEFYYHLTTSSFGTYVDQVGRYGGSGQAGWVFKVNGVSPPVGADQVQLEDGDTVLWYYATFGPAGGPPTLQLSRTGKNCYGARRPRRRRQARAGRGAHAARRRPEGRDAARPRLRRAAPRAQSARPRPGAIRSNALS